MCEIERKHSAATQVWSEKKVEKSSKYFIFFAATASAAAVVVSLVFIQANNRITHLLTIKKWLNLQNF